MKIENEGSGVTVSEIAELTALNSASFRDQVSAALPAAAGTLEIDLAGTRFVDSSGLGALFALYRATSQRDGIILRLLNPRPEIRQLLELTQMQQLFEILPH